MPEGGQGRGYDAVDAVEGESVGGGDEEEFAGGGSGSLGGNETGLEEGK